jgi:hypothetical protein
MLTKQQIIDQFSDLKNILGQFESSEKITLLDIPDQEVICHILDQSVLQLRIVQQLYEIESDAESELWDASIVQWCDQIITKQLNPILCDLADARKKLRVQILDLSDVCDQVITFLGK